MADSPSTLMPFAFADSKHRASDPVSERENLKSYAQARRSSREEVQDRVMADVDVSFARHSPEAVFAVDGPTCGRWRD